MAPFWVKPLRPCSLLCITLRFLHKKRHSSLGAPCLERFKQCRHYAYSAMNTPRNPTPKNGTLSNDQNSGHFGQCQKRWAPGFPGTYFHMIRKYLKLAEVANYNIKKGNSRNQNLRGSTMGGGQRSRIELEPHSRTLEGMENQHLQYKSTINGPCSIAKSQLINSTLIFPLINCHIPSDTPHWYSHGHSPGLKAPGFVAEMEKIDME